MKVVGWIVLLLLATLVATFVGAKHLGVAVPSAGRGQQAR